MRFCVELEETKEAVKFLSGTRQNDFFLDYFKGQLTTIYREGRVFAFFSVHVPLPVPFGMLAGVIAVAQLVIWGLTPWLLLPVWVASVELTRTRAFWFLSTYYRLRRSGYKGTIRYVGIGRMLDLVMGE